MQRNKRRKNPRQLSRREMKCCLPFIEHAEGKATQTIHRKAELHAKRQLQGRATEPNASVAPQHPCYQCHNKTINCDGKDPCPQREPAIRTRLGCRPQGLGRAPRCRRCQTTTNTCNRGRPCRQCKEGNHRHSSYYNEDGTLLRIK